MLLRADIAVQIGELRSNLDGLAGHLGGVLMHAGKIRAHKSRQNTLAPVARLPPEVLMEIFQQCKGHWAKDATSWMFTSHVCRQWRTIALNCPTLWNHIRLTAKWECIEEFMKRSKHVPLIVQQAVTPTQETEQFFANRMERIESLKLTVWHRWDDAQDSVGDAPLLRRLWLNSQDEPASFREDAHNAFSKKILYGNAAPRLEELKLTSIAVDWRILRHSNLRDLRILRHEHAPSNTLSDILSALAAMPLLEVLVLHNALGQHVQPPDPANRPVALRNLRSVAIAAETFVCAHFLDRLDFPSHASVQLCALGSRSSYRTSPPEDYRNLESCFDRFNLSYPLQHVTVMENMQILRFKPSDPDAGVPYDSRADVYDDRGESYQDLIEIRDQPELIIFSWQHILTPLCEEFALPCVVKLSVVTPYAHDTEEKIELLDFAQSLRRIPNIQTLHIRNKTFPRYPGAESESYTSSSPPLTPIDPVSIHDSLQELHPNAASQSEDACLTVLPQLQELILEYALFEEGDAERMLVFLKKRREIGLGLSKISFVRGLVHEEARDAIVPRLQEIVPIVDWDAPDPRDLEGQQFTVL